MRNMLKHVTGVEMYLIFSLLIFVVFFAGMLIWLVFFLKKSQVEYFKNVPLDEKTGTNLPKISLLLFLFMVLSPISAFAQGKPSIYVDEKVFFEWIVLFLIFIAIFLTILTLFVVMQLLSIMFNFTANNEEKQLGIWGMFLGLKPISKEKTLALPEKYDGITELDNPIPAWFNALFGITIVFAVGYMGIYHVWKTAELQDQEYVAEVAYAEVKKADYLKQIASLIDENNVKQIKDKKALLEGEKIFATNCVSCHGKKAEGGTGPNLTDEYWLHGGNINQVFKTIKKGVASKGMIPWEKKLNPLQIQNLASYILTLQGTNPPNPKEPQGEKIASK